MIELYKLGILKTEVEDMVIICPDIVNPNCEIGFKIELLISIGCTLSQIKHILISNPICLSFLVEEWKEKIEYFKKCGLTSLNILLEENPYFLNYDILEIEQYLLKKQNEGQTFEDSITMIQENPYLEI